MVNLTHFSGGRFEKTGSYSRLRRVGPFIWIAGTTAIEPSGKLHAPNDAYAQSVFIFDRIAEALDAVGAELRHVVRTTAYLTDVAQHGSGFIRAHGEVFEGIDPVTSGVEAGPTTPGMVVEIAADAVIHDADGKIG